MTKRSYFVPHEVELSRENKGYVRDESDATTPNDTETPIAKVKVKRTVGLTGGISLIVGTMIGSGIFASATAVSSNSGSVGMTILTWACGGVIAMCGALCYIELGLMIPESSGEYSYLMKEFGDLPAFLFVYTSIILLQPASVAAIVLATADYIVEPFYTFGCVTDDKMLISKLLSAWFLGIILFVNCASTKLATKVQGIFTIAKLSAILMISITGFVRLGQGYTDNFKNPFKGTTTSISKIGYAYYGGLWAYDGWNNLNYVTEELINPKRDLPLSIIIGIPIVTVSYVLINISYLTVLTAAEISASFAFAVTLGNRVYGVMAWIVPVLVACSTFGSANGVAFAGGRLVFATARKGHMPKLLAMVHIKRYTPLPALIFTCIIASVMLIPESSNFETIINYFNFAAWIFYEATFAALLWLRFKKPKLDRPYKNIGTIGLMNYIPERKNDLTLIGINMGTDSLVHILVFIGIPILILLCSIYLVAAPFADNPVESTYCLLFILSGVPVYFAFVKYQIVPRSVLDGFEKLTHKIQSLTEVAMPESEDQIVE